MRKTLVAVAAAAALLVSATANAHDYRHRHHHGHHAHLPSQMPPHDNGAAIVFGTMLGVMIATVGNHHHRRGHYRKHRKRGGYVNWKRWTKRNGLSRKCMQRMARDSGGRKRPRCW